jgi:hypothetical protein
MKHSSPRLAWAAGIALAVCLPSVTRGDEIADAKPLLEANCYGCHGYGAREGNLALDELLEAEDSAATRAQWRKVWKMVRQEFMPPADADPMTAADRKAMARWVAHTPLGVDFDAPDPGRVTMRRLNRMEYEHTVNDLFGVDLTMMEQDLSSLSQAKETRLRDMIPPDDTAYGFDNIGDFQTLSPALLEKYFDIAELVVSKVIVTDGPWYQSQEVERSAIETDRDRETKRTEQVARFNITEDGEYRVEIQFYLGGWQEYGGGFDFTLTFDDDQLAAKLIDVGGQETHRFVREGSTS